MKDEIEVFCGDLFCENCGDCYHCFDQDPCYSSDNEEHCYDFSLLELEED